MRTETSPFSVITTETAPVAEFGENLPPFLRYPDLDGDGFRDRLFFFDVADTGLAPGDTEVCLDGILEGPFRECDAVFVLPAGCPEGAPEIALGLPGLWLLARRRLHQRRR